MSPPVPPAIASAAEVPCTTTPFGSLIRLLLPKWMSLTSGNAMPTNRTALLPFDKSNTLTVELSKWRKLSSVTSAPLAAWKCDGLPMPPK